MQAPRASTAAHRAAVVRWRRNLDRVLAYIERLDRTSSRKDLEAAVDRLSLDRSALARDSQRINEGLERLGADNCDLDPPVVNKSIKLPAAPTPRPSKPSKSEGSPGVGGTQQGSTQGTPRVNTPHTTPSLTPTPANPAPPSPRVNSPAPTAPGAGGDEG